MLADPASPEPISSFPAWRRQQGGEQGWPAWSRWPQSNPVWSWRPRGLSGPRTQRELFIFGPGLVNSWGLGAFLFWLRGWPCLPCCRAVSKPPPQKNAALRSRNSFWPASLIPWLPHVSSGEIAQRQGVLQWGLANGAGNHSAGGPAWHNLTSGVAREPATGPGRRCGKRGRC